MTDQPKDEAFTAGPLRMRAYYYEFEPTGVLLVDRILSAVACAGKAYQHTADWGDDTPPYEPCFRGICPTDWIANAADDAAKAQADLLAALEALLSNYDEFMICNDGFMGNQADAYYRLAKQSKTWDAARAAIRKARGAAA